jgi:signal transduction histidine kinase
MMFATSLRDVPLKRKLTIISLLSSGVALLLACTAFVTHELMTAREALVDDLTSAAAIIGHNSAAALTFDDPRSAADTMQSLSTQPGIVGAALYHRDGRLFAHYAARPAAFTPPRAEPAGHRLEGGRLKLFYEFSLAGEPAGTVYIESDDEGVADRIARYVSIALVVMLLSSAVGLLLSAKLQRGIAGPIADLAEAMNTVKSGHNYTVRAAKHGNDELGSLIEGFNAMLDQIQTQDRALQDARGHLERRVHERTRELQQEIAERELAQAQVEKIHTQLVDASRRVGMAEVATNVLHNVGNVLNSVNVSASLISEQAEKSKIVDVRRLSALLAEHEGQLARFLTDDPRGKHVPRYIEKLANQLLAEREFLLKECEGLRGRVEHIKAIVAMQQNHSTVSGVKESVDVTALAEDALRINIGSLQRHGVEIVRDFGPAPQIITEKHKVLQILVNLVRNAADSCKASTRPDKRMTVRIGAVGSRVTVSVVDNGVGIAPENMTRIFAHGFTTKKDGHGFGLHSGALAARELGGILSALSDGVELGAEFRLELPLSVEEAAA